MTKEKTETEIKEIQYGRNKVFIMMEKDYLTNLFHRNYYMARCNMMEDQIRPEGKIIENIDGCPKSQAYMVSEYAMMRIQAITAARNAHFAKKKLMAEFKLTEEEIEALESSWLDGRIIEEKPDEKYNAYKGKAEFIDSPENK